MENKIEKYIGIDNETGYEKALINNEECFLYPVYSRIGDECFIFEDNFIFKEKFVKQFRKHPKLPNNIKLAMPMNYIFPTKSILNKGKYENVSEMDYKSFFGM